jgi:hypothetical protein
MGMSQKALMALSFIPGVGAFALDAYGRNRDKAKGKSNASNAAGMWDAANESNMVASERGPLINTAGLQGITFDSRAKRSGTGDGVFNEVRAPLSEDYTPYGPRASSDRSNGNPVEGQQASGWVDAGNMAKSQYGPSTVLGSNAPPPTPIGPPQASRLSAQNFNPAQNPNQSTPQQTQQRAPVDPATESIRRQIEGRTHSSGLPMNTNDFNRPEGVLRTPANSQQEPMGSPRRVAEVARRANAYQGTPPPGDAWMMEQAMAQMAPKDVEYTTVRDVNDPNGSPFRVPKSRLANLGPNFVETASTPAMREKPKTPTPYSEIAKWTADLQNGAITQEQYDDLISNTEPPANRSELFGNEQTLRNEFQKHPSVIKYNDVRENVSKIKSGLSKPGDPEWEGSAAGDLVGIFSFMKALDPTSAVRENEYASAENARGVSEDVRNIWNRAVDGLRLTRAQREDFIARANGLEEIAKKDFGPTLNYFKGLSAQYGLKPNNVVYDYREAVLPPNPNNLPIPQTLTDYNALKSGELYIDPDLGIEMRKP